VSADTSGASDRVGGPRDPFRSLLKLAQRHGDVARYRSGSEPAFLLNHPDHVKHVLVDRHANFDKGTLVNTMFRIAVADGLLTSEGERWRRQRRLIQPAFQQQRIAAQAPDMTAATLGTLERWDGLAARGQDVDMTSEMGALTLRITAQALFGADIAGDADGLGHVIAVGLRSIVAPHKEDFQEGRRRLEALVLRMVEERRKDARDIGDLLSVLLRARDEETGQGMEDRQLRDQIITLLLAGYETTANALSWTWYLLSENLTAARHLDHELRTVLGGRPPTVADLPRLRYTRMVFDESLRMYPPAWVIGRRALTEDILNDHVLSAGSVVALCPYTMHRDPRFWDSPEQFDPERFEPERSARRKPFAYFPFGGGPRLCIGHGLALLEAQLIIATIAQRYHPALASVHPVVPERRFVLRPRGGLPMSLQAQLP
jgi:cytochrome P450